MRHVPRHWLGIFVGVLVLLAASSSLLKTQNTSASIGTYVNAPQQGCSGVVFSGPIQIGTGGTYTGNWESTDPAVPAVLIYTTAPVTIVNSCFRGPGELLATGTGTKVTVRQSSFVSTNPNVAGTAKGTPIHTFQAANLIVENCDFEAGGFYGIWVQQYTGDHTPNNTIKILNNRIHNVDGRFSDGHGGYLTNQNGSCHGIVLSNVYGVPGIEIAWNQIINEPYQSGGEIDLINIYESSGTIVSSMQIHDNYLQGEYAADPANANALGLTGSAFTTDGSDQTDPNLTTSFLKIHDNQAVSVGSSGIGIAIGHDIEMYNNRVVSSGQLSDGTNITVSYATGMAYWNYHYPPPAPPPANFGNNSVHDNISGLRQLRDGVWGRNDYYIPVPPTTSFNNAQWNPTTNAAPTLTDEANERLLWEEKLIKQGVTVGSQLVVPPIKGSLQIVSGNNQVGPPNSDLAAPIVVRAVDGAGAPVAGLNLSFMVATGDATATPHFAVTDSTGMASTQIHLGEGLEKVKVNILAAGFPLISADLNTPTVQFSSPSYSVGEGDGSATITVTRSGDTTGASTVDFATGDGTATQRTKYTVASGTLTFNPGDTSKTFTVLVVDEAYVEGNQTLNLTLSNPTSGAVLGSPSTAVLTISDNDSVTLTTNPLDQARFFVQQTYYDFLSRYPDTGGWDYWTSQISQCGTDQTCIRAKRIDVSNAFFFELEYQQTAAYDFRLYRAAYGNNQPFPNPDATNPAVSAAQQTEAKKIPSYAVFAKDRARLVGSTNLAQDQLALANLFVSRLEFLNKYPASALDGFVDAVLATISNADGVNLSSQRSLLIALGSRGAVMFRLANDDGSGTNGGINNRAFIDAEYNRAFVASQYFGYLRRDADIGGFLFWLGQVNNGLLRDGTKQHGMVCSFITSAEYQQRFSSVVTHSNAECQ